MKPQRYGSSAAPCDSGIFVLARDYEALEVECERLREAIKLQASAARTGMAAAKAAGAIMLELATQARAESSPDVLASERAMNAMLTEENEALREDAQRYQWLREQPNDTTVPRIDVVQWQQMDESANEGHGLRLEELDIAIDAARKDQP